MVRHRCLFGELGGDFPKDRVHVLVAAPTKHPQCPVFVIDILGRRFAETEFLTFLVMVVQQWKIELREDTKHVLTLQPGPSIPLFFTRRKIK
jgi:hypothetical protein